MPIKPILVQLRDNRWTVEAVHLGSAIARSESATIMLVRLIPVQHVSWLGTDLGTRSASNSERELIKTCRIIAQDYGVAFSSVEFQYVTLHEALVQAAAYVNAQALFTHLPRPMLPTWEKFQNWRLKHQLATLECELYNLEDIAVRGVEMPSILVRTRKKVATSL
jgi:hypothetical protein